MLVILGIVMTVISDGWYCVQILRGVVDPPIATWLVFGLGSTLSLVSYLKNPRSRKSFRDNVANWIDPFVIALILLCLFSSPRRNLAVGWVDAGCLIAAACITIGWALTGRELVAYILFNAIMCVGYVSTIYRLVATRTNTESFVMWGLSLAIVVMFATASLRARNWLALIYVGRAVVCVSTILTLMIYFEFFSGPR